jgi:hypothetical protein
MNVFPGKAKTPRKGAEEKLISSTAPHSIHENLGCLRSRTYTFSDSKFERRRATAKSSLASIMPKFSCDKSDVHMHHDSCGAPRLLHSHGWRLEWNKALIGCAARPGLAWLCSIDCHRGVMKEKSLCKANLSLENPTRSGVSSPKLVDLEEKSACYTEKLAEHTNERLVPALRSVLEEAKQLQACSTSAGLIRIWWGNLKATQTTPCKPIKWLKVMAMSWNNVLVIKLFF